VWAFALAAVLALAAPQAQAATLSGLCSEPEIFGPNIVTLGTCSADAPDAFTPLSGGVSQFVPNFMGTIVGFGWLVPNPGLEQFSVDRIDLAIGPNFDGSSPLLNFVWHNYPALFFEDDASVLLAIFAGNALEFTTPTDLYIFAQSTDAEGDTFQIPISFDNGGLVNLVNGQIDQSKTYIFDPADRPVGCCTGTGGGPGGGGGGGGNTPIPEPGTWVLLLSGVAGLVALRRRRTA